MSSRYHMFSLDNIWTKCLANPVYSETQQWPDTMKLLMDDPIDCHIINELMRQYQKQGKFRYPIILARDNNAEPYMVVDGTHRVIAAKLLGLETIWVSYGFVETDNNTSLVTTICFSENQWTQNLSDDSVADVFRSVPGNDEIWFTSSMMNPGNPFIIYWDAEEGATKDIPLLHHFLKQLIAKHIKPNITYTLHTTEEPIG